VLKAEEYVINLDLDRERLKAVLLETYKICGEALDTEFSITPEEFAAKLNPYLDSNRVSTPVSVYLLSENYPELRIDVNLRMKKVIGRLYNKKKQVLLNRYLTKL
jgi:hypothetical protein